jgi:ABC-type microcin C transport system permease subunit YejE
VDSGIARGRGAANLEQYWKRRRHANRLRRSTTEQTTARAPGQQLGAWASDHIGLLIAAAAVVAVVGLVLLVLSFITQGMAQASGCSDGRIMLRHVFPSCLAPLVVQMAIAVPEAILIEPTLSFLGLGSQPPEPSWGNMLSAAQGYLYRLPWYALFPGLAVTTMVVGMNLVVDGLQDTLDPSRVSRRDPRV